MRTGRVRPGVRRPRLGSLALGGVLAVTACGGGADTDRADIDRVDTHEVVDGDRTVELRDETGPSVDVPQHDMAMTVDAVEVDGDDILVRLRVENRSGEYLDLGVQGTRYGPLLVMRDDRGGAYEGRAVEPAGIPGERVAHLSFRLDGPIDPAAETFTLELTTQRGPLVSPAAETFTRDGVHWRVAEASEGDPEQAFAAAPRLPELVDFWLETTPLPDR